MARLPSYLIFARILYLILSTLSSFYLISANFEPIREAIRPTVHCFFSAFASPVPWLEYGDSTFSSLGYDKDVRRQHVRPLTDSKFAWARLDRPQNTRL